MPIQSKTWERERELISKRKYMHPTALNSSCVVVHQKCRAKKHFSFFNVHYIDQIGDVAVEFD